MTIIQLPHEPPDSLLYSMCLRYDHSYGFGTEGIMPGQLTSKEKEELFETMRNIYRFVVESYPNGWVPINPEMNVLFWVNKMLDPSCPATTSSLQVYEEIVGTGFYKWETRPKTETQIINHASNYISNMKTRFIVYSNLKEMFVTTPELESSFIEQAKEWGYNLDPDDGDFDRTEINDQYPCLQVRVSTSMIFD